MQAATSYRVWIKVLDLFSCDVVKAYCFVWLEDGDTCFQLSKVKVVVKPRSLLYFLNLVFVCALLPSSSISAMQGQLVRNLVSNDIKLARSMPLSGLHSSPRNFPMIKYAFLLFLDNSYLLTFLGNMFITFSPLVE